MNSRKLIPASSSKALLRNSGTEASDGILRITDPQLETNAWRRKHAQRYINACGSLLTKQEHGKGFTVVGSLLKRRQEKCPYSFHGDKDYWKSSSMRIAGLGWRGVPQRDTQDQAGTDTS
jgi:hypothetical protein